jgi:hypothetical protein
MHPAVFKEQAYKVVYHLFPALVHTQQISQAGMHFYVSKSTTCRRKGCSFPRPLEINILSWD